VIKSHMLYQLSYQLGKRPIPPIQGRHAIDWAGGVNSGSHSRLVVHRDCMGEAARTRVGEQFLKTDTCPPSP
jgi:hypothetical protein